MNPGAAWLYTNLVTGSYGVAIKNKRVKPIARIIPMRDLINFLAKLVWTQSKASI